jgi:hypothetical protein
MLCIGLSLFNIISHPVFFHIQAVCDRVVQCPLLRQPEFVSNHSTSTDNLMNVKILTCHQIFAEFDMIFNKEVCDMIRRKWTTAVPIIIAMESKAKGLIALLKTLLKTDASDLEISFGIRLLRQVTKRTLCYCCLYFRKTKLVYARITSCAHTSS